MKSGLALVALMLSLPVTSHACRCQQLPLATYFSQAQFIAMAKLVAVEDVGDDRVFDVELMVPPYKGGNEAHEAGSVVRLATSASTASCGVQPDPGAVYVVFAYEDESGVLRMDSCTGTRAHLPMQRNEAAGFVDVPARFVPGQLNALFGLEVLRDVSANAPNPDDPDNDKLVGLLDLEALAHGRHMDVYESPSPPLVVIGRIESWDDVESREVGYEVSAAVITAKQPGWYRVRLAGGRYGWVSNDDSGTWFAYAELPVRRLAYLTGDWSGLTWPDAGAGIPVRSILSTAERAPEYPAEVLESKTIGGMPWFRVNVLASEPCSAEPRKLRASGWVPAFGRTGAPNAWYYSRGC